MMTDTKHLIGLKGHLLLATHSIQDDVFGESAIFVCSHDEKGALGLIINRPLESLTFLELLNQFQLKSPQALEQNNIYFGGPIDVNRGFILHSTDFKHEKSLTVGANLFLSSTLELFKAFDNKSYPKKMMVVLGYAGWEPGQLEEEIRQGSWLHIPANHDIIFETPNKDKWDKAMNHLGVRGTYISSYTGRA